MISPDLRLQKPLEDYVEFLDSLNARSVPLLGQHAEISMAFQDPIYNVRGMDAAQKIFLHRIALFPDARYRVQDFGWGRRPATAYLRLAFIYSQAVRPSGLLGRLQKESRSVDCMVEVAFSPVGKVCAHTEFWQDNSLFDKKGYSKLFD
jgi:hypothetical protein